MFGTKSVCNASTFLTPLSLLHFPLHVNGFSCFGPLPQFMELTPESIFRSLSAAQDGVDNTHCHQPVGSSRGPSYSRGSFMIICSYMQLMLLECPYCVQTTDLARNCLMDLSCTSHLEPGRNGANPGRKGAIWPFPAKAENSRPILH